MMRIVHSATEMGKISAEWSFSPETAVVPTMGALHEGHLTLVREARKHARRVIVTVFVNPLQFGPTEDFDRYPRDLDKDAELVRTAGADLVFAPTVAEITPEDMRVFVDPGRMGETLCGQYRPGHFRGVCTIVAKLLNLTRPGVAFFGWKDAQQFLILRKMVQDLNMPVNMQGIETVREADGLAMSSRNAYMSDDLRQAAPVIYRALQAAQVEVENGVTQTARLLDGVRSTIEAEPLAVLQYCEAVSMNTLEPVDTIEAGNTLIAVAAYFGQTRLIDNIRL